MSHQQHQTNDEGDESAIIARQARKQLQKPRRSLLETHFETVIVLLRLRVNSYEKSLFLIILITFLMIVTNMNNYLTLLQLVYPSISDSTLGYSLMTSMRYLDIAQLVNFTGSSAIAVTILCSIYLIGMTLCYVISFINRYRNPQSKPRKYFFGRWFVNMSSYFIQLISFPFSVIFLAFIFCTDSIISDTDTLCASNNTSYTVALIFSIVGFALVVFNEVWIQVFFYNTKLYKKDATRIDKDASFLLYQSIFRLLIAFFTQMKSSSSSYMYLIIFLAVQLTYALFLYVNISFFSASFTFANASLQNATQYGIIIQLAQFLAFVADEVSRATELYGDETTGEKVMIFFATFTFILLMVTPKIREMQINHYLFKADANQVQKLSTAQLHFKISMFQHLNSETSSYAYSDALFKGVLNEHLQNPCIHPNNQEICFCKMKVLYDPKKKKDTPLDKAFLSMNNAIFTKFIVKSWFEVHLHFNQASTNDYFSYLAYSEFLYFKMKNISLALKNLAILENKYLTPMQTYKYFRLKQTIIKFNRKRNHAAYRINLSDKDHRNKLEIEAVILVEDQISQIQEGIKFIIKNNIKFWAYLEKGNVNLQELNDLTKFSLKQLDQLKQLWKECMYYVDYRKKWRFYYCWYHLFILNEKLKMQMMTRFQGVNTVNENDVFSEEIQQEQNMDDDVASVHSNLKADEMERIQIKKVELAFDKRSVVFRVNHDIRGKILSVNRAIYHAFGYSAIELSGQVSIMTLMPRLYSNIHPMLMQNFAQTGKTKTLYSQRKIFCLNKQGYLFTAWKFVKQYVTLTGKCEYVAMIRPITPPAGTKFYYIILTDDWEIDSMSQDFYEGFGLNALNYQNPSHKLLLSLLVLSPRLIRYTKYVKYLTEIDYKQFQIREQPINNHAYDPKKITGNTTNNNNIKGFPALNNMVSKFKRDNFPPQSSQDSSNFYKNQSSLILEQDVTQQNFPIKPPMIPRMTSQISQPLSPTSGQLTPSINIKQAQPDPPQILKQQQQEQQQQQPLSNSDDISPPATRQLAKKKTLVAAPGLPNEDLEQSDIDIIPSGKQGSIERRNSTNEILEQLNLGQNAQFLQTNFNRNEMMKKKIESQLSNSQLEDDTADKVLPMSSDDYEEESLEEEPLKDGDRNSGDEHDTGDDHLTKRKKFMFEKLDNFEKGETVNFRLRIPANFIEMMTFYHNRAAQIAKRAPKPSTALLDASSAGMRTIMVGTNMKTIRNNYLNSETGATTTLGKTAVGNPTGHVETRDRQIYAAIRDTIIGYQLRKSHKEFLGSCTASYKKTGKQKLVVLKFSKYEECAKKPRMTKVFALNHMMNQADDGPKKLFTLTSGLMDAFQKQNSHLERIKRMTQFQSMQSDFTEQQNSMVFSPRDIAPGTTGHLNNNNHGQHHRQPLLSDQNSQQKSSDIEDQKKHTDAAALAQTRISKMNGMGYQLVDHDEMGQTTHGNNQNNMNGTTTFVTTERTLKTFHRDFINRQGAKNISLSQSENIFIKEENHQPNTNIQTIQNLKLFLRLFYLLLIALNGFTFFYGPNYQFPVLQDQSKKIFQTKNVLLSALQAYDLTLDQIMFNEDNYDAAIASNTFWTATTYQALTTELFGDECTYFYQLSSDTDYKETFFDKTLMPYQEYSKNLFSASSLPTGYSQKVFDIDTYDLFSQLVYSLQTLQETTPADVTLSLQPVSFFRTNVFPNLYDGLSATQKNLLNELETTTNSIYSFLIIIIIIISFLVVASFMLLFHMIIVICDALKSIIEAFPMISYRDLRKIKYYNIYLNRNFSYIVEKDDILSGTHSIFLTVKTQQRTGNNNNISEHDGTENGLKKKASENFDLDEPSDGRENIGKKSKDVIEGGFLKDLRMRILILFAVFISIVGVFSAGLLLLILQSTSNLQLILTNGEVIMDSFGDNVSMMIAIKEKTLDSTYYASTFQANIQSIIDSYLVKNLQPHVSDLSFMTFDDDFNTIFYGNPCTEFLWLLEQENANQSECSTVTLSSITKGVASFNAFFKNAIENFIDGNDSTATLDDSTIFEYSRGVYFVNIFEVQLIQNWGTNTYSYLSSQQSLIILYVVIMFLVLLIVYIVITEQMLIGRFMKEYEYFKTVYNMFMPDLIIQREKRIKFWLIKHFILKK